MKLHTNKTLFKQAVKATAEQRGLKASYVEKDYWVTLALYMLFSDKISKNLVFKGGTSLAKCYGIIKRFSEDIDLVLLDVENLSGNQKKAMLKQVGNVINPLLPEIVIDGLTHKTGQIRKTAHQFPILHDNTDDLTRNEIVLEVNWLGEPEPYNAIEISSFIYEMMKTTKQNQLITTYEMHPFVVKAMDIKRTFCEKIMSLIRFSYQDNPIEELRKKIRHTYDLHQLRQSEEIDTFLNSNNFQQMMIKVALNDLEAYTDSRDCLKNHPRESLFFSELDQIWNQLKNTYSKDFKDLVYADLPDENEVYKTLVLIKHKINSMFWIKTENQ